MSDLDNASSGGESPTHSGARTQTNYIDADFSQNTADSILQRVSYDAQQAGMGRAVADKDNQDIPSLPELQEDGRRGGLIYNQAHSEDSRVRGLTPQKIVEEYEKAFVNGYCWFVNFESNPAYFVDPRVRAIQHRARADKTRNVRAGAELSHDYLTYAAVLSAHKYLPSGEASSLEQIDQYVRVYVSYYGDYAVPGDERRERGGNYPVPFH